MPEYRVSIPYGLNGHYADDVAYFNMIFNQTIERKLVHGSIQSNKVWIDKDMSVEDAIILRLKHKDVTVQLLAPSSHSDEIL